MEKKRKQWRLSELDWKSEVIVFLLLMASAFFINRGIKIKGLFMDDLYMWSCYGEQTFRELYSRWEGPDAGSCSIWRLTCRWR